MLSTLPDLHRSFAEQLRLKFQSDSRIHSLLAGGSIVHGGFDKYSDLDFVVVVDPLHYDEIMSQRQVFAGTLGHLLHAFTGEHVGEPRLLICLYGPELLHVDLKFVTLEMLTQRVEEPVVLFTRDSTALERQLAKSCAHWPDMTPEWFESRAWIWLHYAVVKLGRGELFEAMGMLSFFREQVLGPMLYRRANLPQRGVRRIESLSIDPDGLLTSTLATHDRDSVSMAIRMAADAYISLRSDALPENIADDAARRSVLAMLKEYSDRG
ncbi:nucleotidyltransferase domain-containing protein [Salmonella enterica]|nr:nucleotidyltransferase domain-containing protein [Salmonella enterica subsp. enterica serovar Typhimurium]EAO4395978.1 nucleotidyltransferase domain-containing protein [Salmonella enterica]EBQ6076313.1 nucleotidyltransferase domain-containing protein [Salmonella enterica subsp. enterica serovar Mississippi]EBS5837756.1 nucleotidyltransferase domain-containing protein [Salmonella enterica subsp. enterica serovar Sandiego]EBZ7840137.1 nucleotidyltransferase domain-containing protein [Salmonell